MRTHPPPRSRTVLFRAATTPLALALSVGLSACVKDDPIAVEDPDPPTFSFYQFNITGDRRFVLDGIDVDASWDNDLQAVYLGTDDTFEPLGTLRMDVEFNPAGALHFINEAVLSTTDVRVGTAAELNARLYTLKFGRFRTTAWTSDYVVADSIHMSMERVLVWPNDSPEDIEVTGYFTALRN